MTYTISKLFTINLQQEDAELVIQILAKQKNSKAQQLAADLDELYNWKYRESAVR